MTPHQCAIESVRLQNRVGQTDGRETRLLLTHGRTANAVPADSTLAVMLLKPGRTIPCDRLVPIDLYEHAVVRSYAIAQMLLGKRLYERREYAVAYQWLSAAGDRGLLCARLDLAQMKFEGRGISVDVSGVLNFFKQSLPSTVPTAEHENRALLAATVGGVPASFSMSRTVVLRMLGDYGRWAVPIHVLALLAIVVLAMPLVAQVPKLSASVALTLVGVQMLRRDTEIFWKHEYRLAVVAPRQGVVVLFWSILAVSLAANNALVGFIALAVIAEILFQLRQWSRRRSRSTLVL